MSEDKTTFNAFPRIVPAGAETEIVLEPADPADRLGDATDLRVTRRAMGDPAPARDLGPLRVEDGRIRVRCRFDGEQEHTLTVGTAEVRVYSLEPDLFGFAPWKGDLHLHSDCSDGMEPPAFVAAACRRIGLDFMAVTDHHRYEPSLAAVRAFQDAPEARKQAVPLSCCFSLIPPSFVSWRLRGPPPAPDTQRTMPKNSLILRGETLP